MGGRPRLLWPRSDRSAIMQSENTCGWKVGLGFGSGEASPAAAFSPQPGLRWAI